MQITFNPAPLRRAHNFFFKARGWRRFFSAFGCGAAFALAMAPYYFLPLMLIASAALVWLVSGVSHHHSRKKFAGFATGWWFGFGFFLVGMYWMSFSFFVQADQFAIFAPLALFGLPAFLALFPAVAIFIALKFWKDDAVGIVLLALCLSVAEYLRGHILTGLPWNLIGQAFAGNAVLPQLTAWTGVYGLGFLILLLALLPAASVRADQRPIKPIFAVLSLSGFLAIFLFGVMRLQILPSQVNEQVRIQIVQPNIPQREKINWDLWQQNFLKHLELSMPPESASDRAEKYLVIWPENAVSLLAETENARGLIAEKLPANAVLLAGAVRRDAPTPETRYYNGLLALVQSDRAADGSGFAGPMSVAAVYNKHHLVPFGEYLPFYGVLAKLGLTALAPIEEGFTPGEGPATIEVAGLRFSPLICYEVIFPGRMYPRGARPEFLVTVTNDAWFGDTAGPRQHLDQARLRAIETGLPVLRSANTGISAVIDAQGRMVERLSLYETGAISTALPQSGAVTVYAMLGDGLYWGMILMAAGFVWRGVRHGKQHGKQPGRG